MLLDDDVVTDAEAKAGAFSSDRRADRCSRRRGRRRRSARRRECQITKPISPIIGKCCCRVPRKSRTLGQRNRSKPSIPWVEPNAAASLYLARHTFKKNPYRVIRAVT